MFKNYVLGAEVASKGDFHIANISMLLNDGVLVEGEDYQKFGGITLLSKQSNNMPKYIKTVMERDDLTNLEEYIPLTYFKDLLESNIKLVKDLYEEKTIFGKKFVKPKGILKDVLLNEKLVKSVVSSDELEELYKDDLIKGDIKLAKNKHLVWY